MKHAFLVVASTLFALLCAEIAGGIFIFFTTGRIIYSESHTYVHPAEANDLRDDSRPRMELVVHPHFGYVRRPGGSTGRDGFSVTDIKLHRPNGESVFLVGLFGGSVAEGLGAYEYHSGILKELLGKVPSLEGRNIEVYTIAQGAWKQPNQLVALAYYLSRGVRFDLVINVDGFNELAIANASTMIGADPLLPFHYSEIAGYLDSAGSTTGRYLALRLAQLRQEAAECRFALCYFMRLGMVKKVSWDLEKYKGEASHDQLFFKGDPEGRDFTYADFAESWKRAVRLSDGLCRLTGGIFMEFLQPAIHYSADVKVSPQDEMMWKKPVRQGYSLLLEGVEELTGEGINSYSLAGIFDEKDSPPESFYADDCCHPTEEGYAFLLNRIGTIATSLLMNPHPAPGTESMRTR